MKNKNISAFLSLLFPGLGHLYLGQYLDGGILVAASGFLWFIFYRQGKLLLSFGRPEKFWLVIAALVFLYLYAAIDAYRRTK